jgi:pantetheine-phosphate adenylyltransferase
MKTTGIVAGSFDPVTNGHVWVVKEALALVDKLVVVVGVNAAKRYYFSAEERRELMAQVLSAELGAQDFARTEVVFLENDFLIDLASDKGATHIIRRLRNSKDFEEEREMMLFNRKVNPGIHATFVMTPPDMVEISSSTVRGIVGLKNWQERAGCYCHPLVVEAFESKRKQ